MSTMTPVASAEGMKSIGGTRPRSGWCHRIKASNPWTRPAVDVDDRLVVEAELVGLESLRQLDLQREALRCDVEELVVEHCDLPLALGLRVVHGDVRVAQERLRIAVAARQGDADAGRNGEADAGHFDRELEELEHAITDGGRLVVRGDILEQDGELVAPESRDGVDGPQSIPDPRCDAAEQLVAGAVSHAVVDGLEVVEVDEDDRHARHVAAC